LDRPHLGEVGEVGGDQHGFTRSLLASLLPSKSVDAGRDDLVSSPATFVAELLDQLSGSHLNLDRRRVRH